jgi:hypothetical protein
MMRFLTGFALATMLATPAFGATPVRLDAVPWQPAWSALTGSVTQSDKFRVTVSAAPGTRVNLAASGLPQNWTGSWCTPRVCAPFRTTLDIPASGHASVEFQIIAPDDTAAHQHPPAHLRASDGASVATAVVRGGPS